MSLGKPTIKLVFMDDNMRDFAINEATKALETSNSEKVCTFLTIKHNILCIACRFLHEDVIREAIQVSVALRGWAQFWCLCNA